jgi:hypothetical protein
MVWFVATTGICRLRETNMADALMANGWCT